MNIFIRKTVLVWCVMVLLAAGPIEGWAKSGDESSGVGLKQASAKTKDSVTPADQSSLSAEDLGFSKVDIQGDPQFQKDLQARSDMLAIHQTLGLITAVPMVTQYVLGFVTSSNVSNGSTDTSLHVTLGLATTGLYITTAMFAILAPKPKGLKASGNTEFHQILSWIHIPLMILTPLVGDMTNDRIANHQPYNDLATIHFLMATTLVATYLTSMTVMTF